MIIGLKISLDLKMIVDVWCYIHLRWSCFSCLSLDPLLKKQFWHVLSVCLHNFPLYVHWIVLGQVNLKIYKTSIWFMWYLHSKLSGNDFFTTTTQKKKRTILTIRRASRTSWSRRWPPHGPLCASSWPSSPPRSDQPLSRWSGRTAQDPPAQ